MSLNELERTLNLATTKCIADALFLCVAELCFLATEQVSVKTKRLLFILKPLLIIIIIIIIIIITKTS